MTPTDKTAIRCLITEELNRLGMNRPARHPALGLCPACLTKREHTTAEWETYHARQE